MSPFDLICSRDGSLSQTKLAASCFHLALFVTVCWVQAHKADFDLAMWGFYAAVAVGHAAYDKTRAQQLDMKAREMGLTTQQPPAADDGRKP